MCNYFKNRLVLANEDERKVIETEKELHLRNAQKARESLRDVLRVDVLMIYNVLTFNLQKALAFPKLSSSVTYYKRYLYVYDFGVHVSNNKKLTCMYGLKLKPQEVSRK